MLDIIPALLLVTGVVFIILLIVLNKMLYRPLLEFMDNREKSIKKDMENAGKNSSDVEAYKKEADKIISEAKNRAGKLKEDAIKRAKEAALVKVEEKKAELEEKYSQFAKELSDEKESLKEALLSQIPSFKESVKHKLSQI